MATPSHLAVISGDDLPEYPLATDLRLTGHHFTMMLHDRWLFSRLRLTASMEVRGAALDLYMLAQKQAPIGTLPVDDNEIAALLHISRGAWLKLRSEDPSPLDKWTRCVTDQGVVRLMHPVVLEVAQSALTTRRNNEQARTRGNDRKRILRLTESMKRYGAQRQASDPLFVERTDAWLNEHMPGAYRTEAAIRSAMDAVSIEM